MLRKFAYNKIFRTTGMLILFILLLLFPMSKKYSLETKNTKQASQEIKKIESYLLDKNDYVSRCLVQINDDNKTSLAKKLMELIIIDGKYQDIIPNGFKGILPSTIKINNLKIEDNSIYVDFSNEFYELKEEYEKKAIEMIVYNLTSIDDVKNVYISIDNKMLDKLKKTNENITMPLTRKMGINKNVNINSYKNVNEVTVYFIGSNNNNNYYVPVTKVTNNKEDKIKVIIEELTSSKIYETNLMSFLNYNTKLLNYELNGDVLTLNFNNYIFDDVSNKSILEEVIYTICLSIRENYDINEVVFNVNNKEISKSIIKSIE